MTLREITTASRTELEALTVTPLQASYVESVAGSLAEAAATPDAAPWCRGVYAGDAPLGFVMISDGISPENMANPDYLGPYCLWRPLVDRAHQGRGHGAAAARLVAEHLRAHRPDARRCSPPVGAARASRMAATCARASVPPARHTRARASSLSPPLPPGQPAVRSPSAAPALARCTASIGAEGDCLRRVGRVGRERSLNQMVDSSRGPGYGSPQPNG